LSEHEQRTLWDIETGCCADDPEFARRLDVDAAVHRRSQALWTARATLWVGAILLVMGIATARGVLSIGALVSCYGAVILAMGAVSRCRLRTTRFRSQPNGRRR